MENIALIGIDLGKNSFHIHCQVSSWEGRLPVKKFTRPKAMNFWRHARQQPSRWKPVAVLTFMARKLEEIRGIFQS